MGIDFVQSWEFEEQDKTEAWASQAKGMRSYTLIIEIDESYTSTTHHRALFLGMLHTYSNFAPYVTTTHITL